VQQRRSKRVGCHSLRFNQRSTDHKGIIDSTRLKNKSFKAFVSIDSFQVLIRSLFNKNELDRYQPRSERFRPKVTDLTTFL
jgi:hypothetical protein